MSSSPPDKRRKQSSPTPEPRRPNEQGTSERLPESPVETQDLPGTSSEPPCSLPAEQSTAPSSAHSPAQEGEQRSQLETSEYEGQPEGSNEATTGPNTETPSTSDCQSTGIGRRDHGSSSELNNQGKNSARNEIFKCLPSIYKLKDNSISGPFINDYDTLREFLVKELEKSAKVKVIAEGNRNDFREIHYEYSIETKKNEPAVQVVEDLEWPMPEGGLPGSRSSGLLSVFYRFKPNPAKPEESIPEIFFLCNSHSYHTVLPLSDPLFRTQMAKHFIDEKNIKILETSNIAGPDAFTKTTYKGNAGIASQTYLEKMILSLSGRIKSKSTLDTCIDGSGEVLMEVGQNVVRIGKLLTYVQWEKILKLFSKYMTMKADTSSCHILNALEYVNRIDDSELCLDLEKDILQKLVSMVDEGVPDNDHFLSHRYFSDWAQTTNVTLDYYHPNGKYQNIRSWKSAPLLGTVIEAIKGLSRPPLPDFTFTTKSALENERIKLSFTRRGEKTPTCMPLPSFVHGVATEGGKRYFKLGQKWYCLSSTYSEVIDRNFSSMSGYILEDEQVLEIMKFPWIASRKDVQEITVSDVKVFFKISEESAEQVLNLLTKEYTMTDITEGSCLLPQSSDLHKELTKNKDIKKSGIGITLLRYCKEGQGKDVVGILGRKRQICERNDEKYSIKNAALTKDSLKEVTKIEPLVNELNLLNFLRSRSHLTEGEYNELYLNTSQDPRFTVFPGDRIMANKVELFDVMIHDSEGVSGGQPNRPVTYLFHIKDDLKNHTRDACAQIRNASELLWHDSMRNQKIHIELFWKHAVDSTAAESPYRKFLKAKLENLGKQKFMRMFDDGVKIVFVLAFALPRSKGKLSWDFEAVTEQDFTDRGLGKETFSYLKKGDILTKSGYLTDSASIGVTQDEFVEKCKSIDGLENFKEREYKEIWKLCKLGTDVCKMSTIAKLELITLDGCFARYQTGGKRRFLLKLLQLKT